jgi:hypothetical protein
MNQKLESSDSSERSQERKQMTETLKAPIIQLGKNLLGVEVIEDYDQGAGPIDVLWTLKPGSEALPDIRLGFVCLPIITTTAKDEDNYSESTINEIIIKSMMNLVDKLVIVAPTENIAKRISDSIESMPNSSFLQLRKYVTILTPSTLVSKTDILRSREREEVIE